MPTPTGAPSLVDLLARQALALVDQLNAIRAAIEASEASGSSSPSAKVAHAQITALESQLNTMLDAIRAMQDIEAQRVAAATLRVAQAEDTGPKLPPVFGRAVPVDEPARSPIVGEHDDTPELPPIPRGFPRVAP